MKSSLLLIRRKALAALFLLSLLALQIPAQTSGAAPSGLSAAERSLVSNISLESLKNFGSALSSDEMEGRGTMQPGGEKAAGWIAARFKDLGLKPLGDKGSYLQAIKFKETVLTDKTTFKLDGTPTENGKDWGIIPFTANNGSVSGDLVFVAYGIVADSIKRNDLSGINLNGKVVVMLEGPPANIPQKAWEDQKASRIFMQMVLQAGAKAIVYIGHGREKEPPETAIDYFGRRQISLANEDGASPGIPPIIYASSIMAEKMFAKSGVSLKDALAKAESNDFKPFALKQKAEITIKSETTKGAASNVVGYIEGSDPKLKDEAVLFSAHYDAFGKMNGKIYNGAADNALGTAEMLAVAEAFSKMDPKPKRSLIFLAVTGEEYGLYGSKYWAKDPTWDIKNVAANLNLDGIGTEVYGPVKNIVGYGAEHTTMGQILEDVAAAYGIEVMPDPFPEEKVFYRSDHYSFVERGVPALMLMGGPEGSAESLVEKVKAWEKVYYHQPSDDVMDSWHWEGAKTVADIMGIMGLRVADTAGMPSWLSSSRFKDLKRGNTKDLPEEN